MITIRAFEEADREALRSVYLASRNAAFTWNPAGQHQAHDFDVHTEGERILVAVLGGEVLGFASVWEADSFLHNLFVHPAVIRQGIGQALLARCSDYCSQTPTLKCLTANKHARRFYESNGWKILREETGPEGPYLLMGKA